LPPPSTSLLWQFLSISLLLLVLLESLGFGRMAAVARASTHQRQNNAPLHTPPRNHCNPIATGLCSTMVPPLLPRLPAGGRTGSGRAAARTSGPQTAESCAECGARAPRTAPAYSPAGIPAATRKRPPRRWRTRRRRPRGAPSSRCGSLIIATPSASLHVPSPQKNN
jgi:hypothetical protein